MPMLLADLLEGVFQRHGHTVTLDAALEGRSGNVYTVPLLAESGTDSILVAANLDEQVGPEEVALFRNVVADTGADCGIFCHSGALTAEAHAAAEGLVLWDRDALVRVLGEAHLAEALREAPPPMPLVPAAASIPSVRSIPSSVSDLMPVAFRGAEAGVAETRRAPALAPPSEARASPAFPEEALSLLAGLEVPMEQPIAAAPAARGSSPPAPNPFMPPPTPSSWNPWAKPQSAMPVDASDSDSYPPAASTQPGPPLYSQPPLAEQAAPGPRTTAGGSLWSVPAAPPAWASSVVPAAAAAVASPAPLLVVQASPVPMPAAAPAPSQASRPMLPVRLTESDARRKVKDKLFSIERVELVLHPVHLFDYECDLLKEGSLAFDTADGRIQVHGSDKTVLDVDPDEANAPTKLAVDHGYIVTERVVRVPEERAREIARQHVAHKHTRSVEVRVPDANNSLFYTERQKVAPTSQQIRVTHLGIHFRPAWRLMGRNGQIDLDAVDGRELFSEVRGGRTDAMVLD